MKVRFKDETRKTSVYFDEWLESLPHVGDHVSFYVDDVLAAGKVFSVSYTFTKEGQKIKRPMQAEVSLI